MKLSEAITKNLSPEALNLWHKEQLENAFKAGQQSGTIITQRIFAFKQKKRDEKDNIAREDMDDVINMIFEPFKESFPCLRTDCPFKNGIGAYIDRFRDNILENIEFAKQRLYFQQQLHSSEED